MRKHQKKTKKSAKSFRRLALIAVILATPIFAIAAIAAITAITDVSRQSSSVKKSIAVEKTAPLGNTANRNYVTVKVAGQDVQVDPQTGQMKELTPEEAQKMAAGLKQMVNQSTDGLAQVQHPDGSVSMDLEGRFQNVTVARVNKDGTVSQSCVDNPEAAGAFFGIDPKLIENQPDGSEGRKQPRVSPSQNRN